jgi:hypothetical protein
MTGFGALSWKIPTTVASFDQSDVEQCKLFAKQQFELSEIQKDGTSLKDQLLLKNGVKLRVSLSGYRLLKERLGI